MIRCCSHALSLPPHYAQGSLNTLRVWFSAFSSMKTSVVIGHWNISKGGHSLPWFLSFSNRKTIFYWCPWSHLVYRDIKCGPLLTRCFKHPVLPLFGSSDIFSIGIPNSEHTVPFHCCHPFTSSFLITSGSIVEHRHSLAPSLCCASIAKHQLSGHSKRLEDNKIELTSFTVISRPQTSGLHCVRAQSPPTLGDLMNCSPPGSSVRRIFQARLLEWIATSYSRGHSPPRDRTRLSCIGRQILNDCASASKQTQGFKSICSPNPGGLLTPPTLISNCLCKYFHNFT